MTLRNNGKTPDGRTEFVVERDEAPEAKTQKQRLVRYHFGGQNRCHGKRHRR
jgi:hypothetical protein